ncbi:TetR/AcrR family transcriptional regulator [Acetobacter orientalis]
MRSVLTPPKTTLKIKAPRRKQSERSAQTQRLVVQAAACLLQSQGYAATTVQGIARHAGVSLGAMQHHFPTKAQVMAAVLRHYALKRVRLYRHALQHTTTSPQKIDALFKALWTLLCQGPEFMATVEIELARRSDTELAAATAPVLARIDTFMNRWLAAQIADITPDKFTPLRVLTNTMLRGLAVEFARGTDKHILEQAYAMWVSLLRVEYIKALNT